MRMAQIAEIAVVARDWVRYGRAKSSNAGWFCASE